VKFILVPFYACLVLATPSCAFFPDVSPDLATPVWHLAYGVFYKIVFGFVALFNDYLDQVDVFITRALVHP
jgi:hypothetical protein